eukprot:NODE_9045_length_529_cov_1.917910_g9022_i0.p2 GENE.NODE_9045_length_529_cov_1.917910_g9022_i0~~NODE_9045_length_529_cov_1.917910_g9022_i0.p2  ORF type:complete len:133 (+),score=5.34 NODE_9045_length_529_cov_1.917910_g9022_i0:1-399(+)
MLEPVFGTDAEADGDRPAGGVLRIRAAPQRLGQLAFHIAQRPAVDALPADPKHRFRRGQDAVAARLRRQGAVIAEAEIAVIAAQIDHPRALGKGLGAHQVVMGGHGLAARAGIGKFGAVIDDENGSAQRNSP